MKFVNCNLCNNNNTKLFYRINDIDIVRCRKCGLIYQNPQPDNLKELYSQEYYSQEYQDKERLLSSAQVLIGRLAKYVPNMVRMLEIGAGLGYTLKVAQDRGWQVFGTEVSAYAASFAKEKFDLEIFKGSLKDAGFNENSFDLVIATHVLEHLPDPYQSLEIAFQILKSGGLLYIVVPNIASFQAWRQKERSPLLKPGFHLYHFSPITLQKMVEKAGFRVMHIDTVQHIATAESLSKTGITPLSFLGQRLKTVKRHFPFIFDAVRNIAGRLLPGEGITLIAKK